MATLTAGAALRQIEALFGRGIVAGQDDGQLLDRFLARRDALAFETLVDRHGPMVLSVCRGTLRDPGDAEDAFQATFLVLVRKAGSIRGRDGIGPWLHRVAHRVSVRANIEARRRRDRERRAGEARAADAPRVGPREELRAALHEEIDRLPDRLRRPLVLCHLEARTHAQAASELRLGEATVRRRLARARDLLGSRLARRGVVPAVPIAVILGAETAVAVPMSWTAVAVRAAMGATFPGGIVTPAASMLSRRVSRAILVSRLKRVATSSAAGLVAWTVWGLVASGARPVSDPKVVPPPRAPVRAAEAMVEVRGRVVDAKGAAIAGARVVVTIPTEGRDVAGPAEPLARTASGRDGGFRVDLPASRLDDLAADPSWRHAEVMASADGFGPAWASVARAREAEVTLRLVADDVPLVGRVLDLEGRPVAGARVAVGRVATAKGGDLTAYLGTVRDGTEDGNGRLLEDHWSGPFPGRPGSVATGPDGRFSLSGFGRDRLVELTAEAPAIQRVTFLAMTRDAEAVGGPGEKSLGDGSGRVHGARFDLIVPPGRTITGVVRDKATHTPIPGMFVKNARSLTDRDGRFVATGFAKGKTYDLIVSAGRGQPYFVTCAIVPDTPGLSPIEADVECVPGIPFRLKLTEKATGKPVAGEVTYSPVYPNRRSHEVVGYEPIGGIGSYGRAFREPDGTYVGGVLPGPGAIFVRDVGGKFRHASVDPHQFFAGKPGGVLETDGEYGNRRTIMTAHGTGFGVPTGQAQFQAIVLTNAPEGSGPLSLDVALERDDGHAGRVLGPDGRPMAGARVDGLAPMNREPSPPLASAEFRVIGLTPGQSRRLTVTHEAKRLSGFLLVRGDERDPYEIRLRPWATLSGRLVDEAGRPRPGVAIRPKDWQAVLDDPRHGLLDPMETDASGRFRIEGLVAGLKYDARLVNVKDDKGFGVLFDDLILGPGEARDLGDVRAKTKP